MSGNALVRRPLRSALLLMSLVKRRESPSPRRGRRQTRRALSRMRAASQIFQNDMLFDTIASNIVTHGKGTMECAADTNEQDGSCYGVAQVSAALVEPF